MDDYIVNLIKDVMLGVTDLGSGSSILTKTPETFNAALFNGVNSIVKVRLCRLPTFF